MSIDDTWVMLKVEKGCNTCHYLVTENEYNSCGRILGGNCYSENGYKLWKMKTKTKTIWKNTGS